MTDQNNQTQTVNVDRENQCENTQPNEQCPICQEQITQNNASFVDLCLHQYCFECLKKWCEVSIIWDTWIIYLLQFGHLIVF